MSDAEETLRRGAMAHLRRNAHRYLDGAEGDLHIEIVREIRREASRMWFVDMSRGSATLHLAVKKLMAPAWEDSHMAEPARYRVAWIPPLAERTRREGEALREIEAFARSSADPRIGGVHVYDVVPEERLLVMERASGEELRSLLLRDSRRGARSTPDGLIEACHNAGAWLSRFHEVMPQKGTLGVADDPEEFRRICDRKIAELEKWLPDESWWRDVRDSIEAGLARSDEAFSARATAHGDFWMGNVLCEPDGRVVVIDTLGANFCPVYVDIAYFLMQLRAEPQQIYSWGRWCREDVLQACESAFLSGYGPTISPTGPSLPLFQILVLVYKWASSTRSLEETRGLGSLYKRATLAWRGRYFRQLIERYRSGLE